MWKFAVVKLLEVMSTDDVNKENNDAMPPLQITPNIVNLGDTILHFEIMRLILLCPRLVFGKYSTPHWVTVRIYCK